MNPFLGRNFEAMDPLEWLARMSDHIPDPRQHRTLFYGEYSNRVRGSRSPEAEESRVPTEPPRKRCSPGWARLIAKVYEVSGSRSLHARACYVSAALEMYPRKQVGAEHELVFGAVLPAARHRAARPRTSRCETGVVILYGRPNFLRNATTRGSPRTAASSGAISTRPNRCGAVVATRSNAANVRSLSSMTA